ncbi:DUF5990 family protein [Nocardioides sp. WV_118_6]|uniref:DUF5990 family protein n=1 Tax=Nocardioides simplex TaxID=2045 RepID=UPI00214FC554|nr:DUF5990 family protein [Pimelobacter simplex]UUW91114.1 DUF5990 family protein [Pimelobacter simplex]UUW94942.1 DUF5990 family protein [Pimelobacter simplex]
MLLEIRGHHLPGRTWAGDAVAHDDVHVGLQVGREPAELVPGDADRATWTTELRLVDLPDGTTDVRGPAVQGRRGERFVYLTWGDLGADGGFAMFRRAKLMLADVLALGVGTDSGLGPDDHVVATVDLTDERGGPRCARLEPPALTLALVRG